jgi:D-alanyl-D-alanine carboxypeptidase
MFRKLALTMALSLSLAHADTLTAKSWLVTDATGTMIGGMNTSEIRSIASITKLITVMVVLDANQDLNEVLRSDRFKNLTRAQLIDLAMVKSDNYAAMALCQNYPGGFAACVQALNAKVASLGMVDTVLFEPTGLNSGNVSTANDLAKLVQAASDYPVIVAAAGKDTIKVAGRRNRSMTFHNTNTLIGQGYNFVVSKTGFINKSGGCIVFQLLTENGLRTVILLGSKNTRTRIPEAASIAKL